VFPFDAVLSLCVQVGKVGMVKSDCQPMIAWIVQGLREKGAIL
jgi:hypothetical protein